MVDQELLEALGQMMDAKLGRLEQKMDSKLDEKLAPVNDKLDGLQEEAKITRHSVNLLLNWAERADRTVVNAGLYPKED